MAAVTTIAWAEYTWNISTGCDRVSPGCANCYALATAPRWKAAGNPRYQTDGDPRTSGPGFGVAWHPTAAYDPLRRRTGARWFVNSMSDLLHPKISDGQVAHVLAVAALAPRHRMLILTKRSARLRHLTDPHRTGGPIRDKVVDALRAIAADPAAPRSLARDPHAAALLADPTDLPWPIPTIWWGVSVENADYLHRVDDLRAAGDLAVRWISAEPLIGPLTGLDLTGMDWIVVGGESGRASTTRPMDAEWARAIRDAAESTGTAYFYKQNGLHLQRSLGGTGKGEAFDDLPEDLRIRRYPAVNAAGPASAAPAGAR